VSSQCGTITRPCGWLVNDPSNYSPASWRQAPSWLALKREGDVSCCRFSRPQLVSCNVLLVMRSILTGPNFIICGGQDQLAALRRLQGKYNISSRAKLGGCHRSQQRHRHLPQHFTPPPPWRLLSLRHKAPFGPPASGLYWRKPWRRPNRRQETEELKDYIAELKEALEDAEERLKDLEK
jgi:hypothetical protein